MSTELIVGTLLKGLLESMSCHPAHVLRTLHPEKLGRPLGDFERHNPLTCLCYTKTLLPVTVLSILHDYVAPHRLITRSYHFEPDIIWLLGRLWWVSNCAINILKCGSAAFELLSSVVWELDCIHPRLRQTIYTNFISCLLILVLFSYCSMCIFLNLLYLSGLVVKLFWIISQEIIILCSYL